jgi:hypothetical protein
MLHRRRVVGVASAVFVTACGSSAVGRDTTTTRVPLSTRADSAPVDHSAGIAILSCVERRDTLSTYHYQLRNSRSGMIVNWELGYSDDEPQDSASENNGGRLSALPVNSSPKFGATDDWLPVGAYTAPEHWRPEFSRVEETGGFFISWVAEAPSNEVGLAPGERLSGFSVTVRGADSVYLTGPWTAYNLGATNPMGRLIPAVCDSIIDRR